MGQLGVEGTHSDSSVFELIVSLVDSLPLISSNTVTVRLLQYAGALDIAILHPVFGLGGWNFYLVATDYGLTKPFHIHSTYFEYLAGTGIPGVFLFMAAIATGLWMGVRIIGQTEDDAVQIGMLIGVTSVHLFAAFVVLHNSPTVYGAVWFLTGVLTNAATANR